MEYFRFFNYTDLRFGHKLLNFVTSRLDQNFKKSKYVNLHQNFTDLHKTGFALETFPSGPNYVPDEKLCLERTSEHLRHLIERCNANVALRDLTEEEKQQLEKLKEQSKGKVVHLFDHCATVMCQINCRFFISRNETLQSSLRQKEGQGSGGSNHLFHTGTLISF